VRYADLAPVIECQSGTERAAIAVPGKRESNRLVLRRE
jgi:hypothetical protein